jgi:hypothetical protein
MRENVCRNERRILKGYLDILIISQLAREGWKVDKKGVSTLMNINSVLVLFVQTLLYILFFVGGGCRGRKGLKTEAEFLVPAWGDKVDYGIVFSYWSARLHRLADRNDNPMP